MAPQTMYDKIWESHLVRDVPGEPSLIYIDRHLVHEGTSPRLLRESRRRGARCAGLI